ncbi:TraX family protein [Jeotgalibaca sp. A127]|uniref:TraX family protein n=1 Tax=Jeotgalibaca sp. A127 TaxID=3457324 RepID=UPI003FD37A57
MNLKTNTIKWLAMVTMTIDHIGYYVFPEYIILRLIGRLAFPCFLFTTIQGVKQTANFPMYFLRLLGMALISVILMSPIRIYWNILFSLAIFALSLKDKRLFLPTLFLSYFTEYSVYGFLLGWAIKIMLDKDRIQGIVFILALHLGLYFGSIQFFALIAVVFMLLPMEWRLPRFPKWLGYLYYPIHQVILFWLGSFIK